MTNEVSFRPVRVSSLREVGSAIVLTWKRDFAFLPGQLAELALAEAGPSRLYSICSGPRDDEAGVLFTLVEVGALSPGLAHLREGDELWLKGPSGSFPAVSGLGVWIANGTGVAPFVSMARAGLAEGKTLLHGARELEDFYFQDELALVMGERYVRCRSRPALADGNGAHGGAGRAAPRGDLGITPPDGLYEGRLTAYLESKSWDPGLPYELCGSASMVVDVRELLIAKGVPHSRIVSEVYY